MKYTFEEKMKYNKQRYGKNDFSSGYVIGGTIYKDYPTLDATGKKEIHSVIDSFHKSALSGDEFSKGFMCAVRDGAKARKLHPKRK